MPISGRRARIAAVAALLVSHAALAQTNPANNPTDPAQPIAGTTIQGAPPPVSPSTPLLGPAVRLGQDLLAAGILPRLRYIDAFAANPIGGLKQGADNSGVVVFGADMDANKLIGIPGGLFHVTFAQFYGHELSTDNIGSRTKVQSYYYPYKQFELTELTYEQSFFGDTLNLLAGRANATGEFARDTFGCRFENVADCPLELTQLVGGFPGFPYVNWGGRVRVRPTQNLFIKAGAYEIEPARNKNSGFAWDTTSASGLVMPVEIGYGTTFADDPTPRNFKAGLWYNNAPYADPYLNTKRTSRALFGGAALNHPGGRAGGYLLGDQMVWRHDSDSPRGITVFGATAAPFDNSEPFNFQGVLGAVWTGPFDSRPADQIGVLANFIELSPKENRYLNGLLLKAHSPRFIPANGMVFEVNYGYRLAPGIVLQPAMQYLVNPDDLSKTNAKVAPRDALVVGLKLSVNANQILGLPEQLSKGFRSTE
jgi:porin